MKPEGPWDLWSKSLTNQHLSLPPQPQGARVSLEQIKDFIRDNKKGLIVGAVAALIVRALVR